MEQEKVRQEMTTLMGQLSLDQQRRLLALARAAKEAENCLSPPAPGPGSG